MKKIFFCLAIVTLGNFTAQAQDGERIFKRFKGDVSLGYAAPLGPGSNGGMLFAMEPKLAIIDQLAVGLRIEAAVMAKFSGTDIYGDPQVSDAKGSGSYVATADYYFTNNYSFRPFIGGGAGVFSLVFDDSNYDDDVVTATKFGGLIRVGGEVKHFRFGVEYNFIPATEVNSYSYDNLGNPITTKMSLKNSYIGIKLGVCFGGGPLR